ncbi:YlzJ-like family protein [Paenibacillus sp. NPDC057967]|uniref:YlzJ-like family protein n=1 Tax=Paenibacillus sp. NPDC057967 TaxID=3346293 RepID=UPI0036D9D1ED
MTLHTVMPLELVLQGIHDEQDKPMHEVTVRGIKMQVIPVAPGMGRIVRLLDCSLHDYLNPAFMPGAVIPYNEIKE